MTIIPLETQLVTLGIMGLKPWAFLLVMFIVFAGGLIAFTMMWDSHKQTQNRKLTMMPDGKTRKILGVFVAPGKTAYEVICSVTLGEVYPNPKDKKVKAIGTLDAPNVLEQRIPKYFILDKFCFQTMWPKGAKQAQQVEIMEAFYRENFSLPALSYEEMDTEERVKVTALLTGISSDQSFSNAVVTEVQQKFTEFTKAVAKLKNLQLILIMAAVACLLGLFNLFYNFQAFEVLNSIKKFFLGG